MVDPERELEATLKLARMLAEPSMADGARVLSAVRSEIAVAPEASAPTHAAATASRARSGRSSSRVQPRAGANAALQGAALKQLITVGAVAAALGFAAGWGLRDVAPRADDVAPREMMPLPPPAEPPSEPPVAKAERPAPEPEAEAEAEAPEPAQEAPSAEPSRAPRPPARKRVAPVQRKAPVEAPAGDSSAFFEAVNLLRRAQRAVNRGDGQVALGLLAELDARFDAKTLGEERQATRALALCQSGDAAAAARVSRELSRVAPSSIYADRLRLSCAGWATDTGANGAGAPGTEPPAR